MFLFPLSNMTVNLFYLSQGQFLIIMKTSNFNYHDLFINNTYFISHYESNQFFFFILFKIQLSQMRRLSSQAYYRFSQNNYLRQKKTNPTQAGSFQGLVDEKKQMSQQIWKKHQQSLPSQQKRTYYRDNLVQLTLYMNHDCQRSLYLFYILNFQKLGFRKISDLAYLDNASYRYQLRKTPESQRWPLLNFCYPMGKPIILKGFQEIYGFLGQKNCLQFQIQTNDTLKYAQDYVDNEVAPWLETLFWHPRLTLQYSLHMDSSSYIGTYNIIFGILYRNILLVTKRIYKNFKNILNNKEKYEMSKSKLTESLREVEKILNGKQYFGGDKPHHFDFYLFALLKTKWSSKHFQYYIQNEIGKQFWSWVLRMNFRTQYIKQRITLL